MNINKNKYNLLNLPDELQDYIISFLPINELLKLLTINIYILEK